MVVNWKAQVRAVMFNSINLIMKRLFKLCILLSFVGCTEVAIDGNMNLAISEEYYAVIEEGKTRTYVDEQIRMRWTAEDYITLFEKNTYNRTFMFTGKTGANAGGFTKVSTDDDYMFAYDVDANYAVYPHSSDIMLDETDLFLTLNMPAEQTYAENSFGLGANTMVAVSDNNQLVFKNVGSYLRVRLYGENTTVSSVTLTTKGDEAISGEAKVTPVKDGEPTCVMTGSGKSIRLTCFTPITISSDADAPTDFWIVVPPVTLASGFTVTVENSDGNTQTFDVNQSFTFERNKYINMLRELEIEGILTIQVEEAGTLSSLIPDEDKSTITSLKLLGELNGTDIKFLRENMLGCTTEQLGSLKVLDLSKASIVEGGEAYYNSRTTKSNVIGNNMFYDSETLEKIILPNNISTIESYAFGYCSNLNDVVMFGNVKTISESAFRSCNLNQIVIPDGVETIGYFAFCGIRNLKSVTIPKSVTRIEDEAFSGSGSGELNVYIEDLYKFMKALYPCSSPCFPNYRLFLNNNEVNDLVIPDGIIEVPTLAYCLSLTSVTLLDGDYFSGAGTFFGCENLKQAKLSDSCINILPAAFADTGLTTITIGSNVAIIFYEAFRNCPLNTFYCHTQIPPTINYIPAGMNTDGMLEEQKLSFRGVAKENATLYVPKGCKAAYEASDWANYFGTIVEMN